MTFEVKYTDLAGRIGRLHIKGRWLETPIYLPVIHPVNQLVPSSQIFDIGYNAVITNAYITYRKYGEEAKERGIHNIIGFPGIVMTDSGGYQILEYGEVEVDPIKIAEYQRDIKSDIAVILDTPTGYRTPRNKAVETVRKTIKVALDTLPIIEKGGPLWVGPIQGGDHLDLVSYSVKEMTKLPFDLFAIGSPVEIMNNYDFTTLVKIVMTAKAGLPLDKPVHLFGAGHPLTMALAVAMGCDLFDSASYILFAREGRYMTFYGVKRLEELTELPCCCPICSRGLREILEMSGDEKVKALALHNLYVLKAELNAIKNAIREGRLWEYVSIKSKSHPALYKAVKELFTNKKYFKYLDEGTPMFKEKAIFLFDEMDRHRPEVVRHHERVRSLRIRGRRAILLVPETYEAALFIKIRRNLREFLEREDKFFIASPYFGPIPIEVHDVYPLSQNTMVELDEVGEEEIESYKKVLESFKEIVVVFERGKERFSYNLMKILKDLGKEVSRKGPVRILDFIDNL